MFETFPADLAGLLDVMDRLVVTCDSFPSHLKFTHWRFNKKGSGGNEKHRAP